MNGIIYHTSYNILYIISYIIYHFAGGMEREGGGGFPVGPIIGNCPNGLGVRKRIMLEEILVD